jgi:hypothetical protein
MIVHAATAGELLGRTLRHKSACEPRCAAAAERDATCKVCTPVPDKKKVTKVVYECKEEWYCLPKCPCPQHIGKHAFCGPCAPPCATCEKPRCRRVLVKKIVTEDRPTTKCLVDLATTGEK